MSITNAEVADRACELAEASEGLQRMAALCVSAAAATTGTFRCARKALEVIPHLGLCDARARLRPDLRFVGCCIAGYCICGDA